MCLLSFISYGFLWFRDGGFLLLFRCRSLLFSQGSHFLFRDGRCRRGHYFAWMLLGDIHAFANGSCVGLPWCFFGVINLRLPTSHPALLIWGNVLSGMYSA